MLLKKLTVLSAIAFTTAVILFSCKKNPSETIYSRTSDPMTVSQQIPVPGVASNGSGNISASYSTVTKTLTYTLSWQNLTSDSIRLILLHGPAEPGFAAPVVQAITPAFTGFPLKATASYSNTLFVDGTVVKEDDLLANKYYFEIRTKANPGGEIRGQLILQ